MKDFLLFFCRKDQNLLSPVNCWYLLLNQVSLDSAPHTPVVKHREELSPSECAAVFQVRRESKDHATLSDLYLNNVISRLTHISEDSARLLKRVRSSVLVTFTDQVRSLEPVEVGFVGFHRIQFKTHTNVRSAFLVTNYKNCSMFLHKVVFSLGDQKQILL